MRHIPARNLPLSPSLRKGGTLAYSTLRGGKPEESVVFKIVLTGIMAFFLGATLPAMVSADAGSEHGQESGTDIPPAMRPDYQPPAPGSYELPVLDRATNGEVLTTDGASRKLHDLFADRYVLLSFIYTTCPDPQGRPMATGVLYQTLRLLA